MKYLISTFVLSAFAMMSFKISERMEFADFFKMAFVKSFDGLDNMRNSKNGDWEFNKGISDFDACEIRYDLQRGLHHLHFVRSLSDESTARQFMERFRQQVQNVLPMNEYRLAIDAGDKSNKMVYDYYSTDIAEKAKHPVVELTVAKSDTGCDFVINLYEPFNRQAMPLKEGRAK